MFPYNHPWNKGKEPEYVYHIEKRDYDYWVHEEEKDGNIGRTVAKFHTLQDAEDFVEMKKVTQKFRKDILEGKVKKVEIPF